MEKECGLDIVVGLRVDEQARRGDGDGRTRGDGVCQSLGGRRWAVKRTMVGGRVTGLGACHVIDLFVLYALMVFFSLFTLSLSSLPNPENLCPTPSRARKERRSREVFRDHCIHAVHYLAENRGGGGGGASGPWAP